MGTDSCHPIVDGYIISQIVELLWIGNKIIMACCKVILDEKSKYDANLMVKKLKATENQELKANTIQLVQDKVAGGYSNQKISEAIRKSERTVQRYQNAYSSGRHGKKESNVGTSSIPTKTRFWHFL